MKTEPSDDERMEALLRRPDPSGLPDDGFTLRVLQALPPRRTRTGARRRVLLAGGAVAGLAAWLARAGATPAGAGSAQAVMGVLSNPIAVVALGAALAAAIVLSSEDNLGVEF